MNAREQGFVLLTGFLGDPQRKPLTIPQFRELARRAQTMERPVIERELTGADLRAIGCSQRMAERIVKLLSDTEQLQWYLQKGAKADCYPITRLDDAYPERLRKCLGMDAPGVLWAKGDISLLRGPAVALVGSRELLQANREFAYAVGKQAALQGYTLVSGDARGADRTAQESCLEHGGKVICVVADEVEKHPLHDRILYLSEEGFDLGFSAHRALQRNHVIHSLAARTFVAQCRLGKGGTWNGTVCNLRKGWSPVFCFKDGSAACTELEQLGATAIDVSALEDIGALRAVVLTLFDS